MSNEREAVRTTIKIPTLMSDKQLEIPSTSLRLYYRGENRHSCRTIILVRRLFTFLHPLALFSSSPTPIFPSIKIPPPRPMLKLQPIPLRPIPRPRPTIKAKPRALLRLARRNFPRWRYLARKRIDPTQLLTCRAGKKVMRFGILCVFQL